MSISSFQIFGSGCCEMYPVDPSYRYPYQYCVDQNAGGTGCESDIDTHHRSGYGDAFGTATVQSNPAWVIWLDGGEIAYNTQDGIDGLHVSGLDSSGVPSQLIMVFNHMPKDCRTNLRTRRIFFHTQIWATKLRSDQQEACKRALFTITHLLWYYSRFFIVATN